MKTYRVWCQYEPELRRLGGQVKGSTRRIVKRGAWRVIMCNESTYPHGVVHINYTLRLVGIYSPHPQRVGTLVDPFKLLKAWLNGAGASFDKFRIRKYAALDAAGKEKA